MSEIMRLFRGINPWFGNWLPGENAQMVRSKPNPYMVMIEL